MLRDLLPLRRIRRTLLAGPAALLINGTAAQAATVVMPIRANNAKIQPLVVSLVVDQPHAILGMLRESLREIHHFANRAGRLNLLGIVALLHQKAIVVAVMTDD